MRTTGRSLIVIAAGQLIHLLWLLVVLPMVAANTALPNVVRDGLLWVGTGLAEIFSTYYFAILPGLVVLGLAFFYEEKISGRESEKLDSLDFTFIGAAVFSMILLFWASAAAPDSIFFTVYYTFGFLDYIVTGLGKLSPDLQTFTLWFFLFVLISCLILVYGSLSRLGWDKTRIGGLSIAIAVAFTFGVFLQKNPIFQLLEEFLGVNVLFQQRDVAGETDKNGTPYCPAPYDDKGKQLKRLGAIPPGIRDDIVIFGISKETIEKTQGKWPLDWEHYARLADKFGHAPNGLLLFDISFVDRKGPYGAEYCGIRFNCSPRPGFALRNQWEVLSAGIEAGRKRGKAVILADYPIETTDEARDQIINLNRRIDDLDVKNRLIHVKNSRYAGLWGKLPQPPISPVTKALDGIGYANILKNRWGLNRKMPMVIRIKNEERAKKPGYDPDKHDDFYPGIDLLIVAHRLGVDPIKDVYVDWLRGWIKIKNIPKKTYQKRNLQTFKMETFDIMAKPNPERVMTIPIDRFGLMNINFRGGRYCFRFYELLDVTKYKPEDVGANFANKIALTAMYYATGVGTAKDMHLSPFGDMAGIEHHAHALNTVLNQDFAVNAPPWVNILILLVIGIIMGLYQPRVPTWLSLVLIIVVAGTFISFTVFVSFERFSYLHVFPTVILEQLVIFLGFIGFRVLTEEENVKFIRNTFSKFVAQDVVEELLSNPDAIALGGAKKEVSVFFSDVRGFTTISEKLGPEELVQLLNDYLSVMTELIIEYRGTVDKYMGDAIMAFWGAPVQNDDHAYYTCVASIAQYNALIELREQWMSEGSTAIDIGIGINSGQAVVGNMGSSHRMDYTLMGDTVNLGSRLEGITKTYGVKICISEYTYEKVKDRVYARELDLVRVKGKLEPVRIYELIGLKDESDIEKLKKSARKAT